MRSYKLLAVLVALPLLAPAARADDADRAARQAAYDIVVQGRELYNAGKQDECLRLYEGALTALKATTTRPGLAKLIQGKLDTARGQRTVAEKAFTLREALDEVMKEPAAKKPLWDRLGGEPAVRKVIGEFLAAAGPDPKVNFDRNGQFKLDPEGAKKLTQYLVELVSAVTGGPLKYTGRDMKKSHAGMKITDAEFDALAGHLVAVLKKNNVPQAEADELVAIVASTRKDIVEVAKKPLWDRLGGEEAVRAVVVEFLTTAAKDPKVNVDRNGNYPLTKERGERVTQLLVEFVSSATGGPLKYAGRDMKNTHQGMRITEDEFNAAATHLVAALKKYKVPQAEIDELVAIVATTAKDMVEVKK